MNVTDSASLDWVKMNGLIPAIVQDSSDGRVLMQAFMNREALDKTLTTKLVTFWSRSREALWTKGETSGNYLQLVGIRSDCDDDCLLIQAKPTGPVCHLGTATCFDTASENDEEQPRNSSAELGFLSQLEQLIAQREQDRPEGSYTTQLFDDGIKRIAQKVGEEGVETALAAVAGDAKETISEAADLVYHLLVLLRAKKLPLSDVIECLQARHQ
jgi:phosphoribosyl-ATP pyrophosphohydrolase/phosphoribosyl-AMP cyclohydrolase